MAQDVYKLLYALRRAAKREAEQTVLDKHRSEVKAEHDRIMSLIVEEMGYWPNEQ